MLSHCFVYLLQNEVHITILFCFVLFCYSYKLFFRLVQGATNPTFARSAGESAYKRLKDGWMEVTLQAHKTVLSCTVTTASFPASCCGMLKVSSFSPKGS